MRKKDYSMPVRNKLSELKIGKYLKYTIFATNILVIISLFISSLAWLVKPSEMIITAYWGLAFPLILFINVAYLILWLVAWRWKYTLVQLLAIILCWLPIKTYFPVNFRTKKVPEKSIKILSYNVQGFNWRQGDKGRNNPVFNYILKNNADIVCFQEFLISRNNDKKGIITEKEINAIMKDYPFHSVMKIKGGSHGSVVYGIACYSKYPILESTEIPIDSNQNGSIAYTLDIQGKKVTLVNNHLESNKLTAEDKKLYREFLKTRDHQSFDDMSLALRGRLGVAYRVREKQADMIKEYINKQKTDAVIVCGDFNDTPISYTYRTVKGDLEDSQVNSGFGQNTTYNEKYFFVKIDYIFHSKNMDSYNFTVDKVKYSDHYPIWTYLSFK